MCFSRCGAGYLKIKWTAVTTIPNCYRTFPDPPKFSLVNIFNCIVFTFVPIFLSPMHLQYTNMWAKVVLPLRGEKARRSASGSSENGTKLSVHGSVWVSAEGSWRALGWCLRVCVVRYTVYEWTYIHKLAIHQFEKRLESFAQWCPPFHIL